MAKPAKKVTEVDALLAIAKAINRLAAAAEIIASPPKPEQHQQEGKTDANEAAQG
jgi:hypothetical protein